MSEKEQANPFRVGVIPEALSEHESQSSDGWTVIGMCSVKGRKADFEFPEEYHKELEQLCELNRQKREKLERRIEKLRADLWVQVKQLQKRYLKQAGFTVIE